MFVNLLIVKMLSGDFLVHGSVNSDVDIIIKNFFSVQTLNFISIKNIKVEKSTLLLNIFKQMSKMRISM